MGGRESENTQMWISHIYMTPYKQVEEILKIRGNNKIKFQNGWYFLTKSMFQKKKYPQHHGNQKTTTTTTKEIREIIQYSEK